MRADHRVGQPRAGHSHPGRLGVDGLDVPGQPPHDVDVVDAHLDRQVRPAGDQPALEIGDAAAGRHGDDAAERAVADRLVDREIVRRETQRVPDQPGARPAPPARRSARRHPPGCARPASRRTRTIRAPAPGRRPRGVFPAGCIRTPPRARADPAVRQGRRCTWTPAGARAAAPGSTSQQPTRSASGEPARTAACSCPIIPSPTTAQRTGFHPGSPAYPYPVSSQRSPGRDLPRDLDPMAAPPTPTRRTSRR